MPMDLPAFGPMLQAVSDELEAFRLNDEQIFALSETIFSADSLPTSRIPDRRGGNLSAFCFEMQTANTDKFNDSPYSEAGWFTRVAHTLTVRIAFKVSPKDQFASQVQSFEREEYAMFIVQRPTTLPACRVLYRSTARRLSESREFIITDIVFDVEHSWP